MEPAKIIEKLDLNKGEDKRDFAQKELEIAINVLVELRELRKRRLFLQMLAEIGELKKKLDVALNLVEHYQNQVKEMTIENDWLHSLTTPQVKKEIHPSVTQDDAGKKTSKKAMTSTMSKKQEKGMQRTNSEPNTPKSRFQGPVLRSKRENQEDGRRTPYLSTTEEEEIAKGKNASLKKRRLPLRKVKN